MCDDGWDQWRCVHSLISLPMDRSCGSVVVLVHRDLYLLPDCRRTELVVYWVMLTVGGVDGPDLRENSPVD